MSIVQMLNQLYTAFDTLTDPRKNPNVYKVKRDDALWLSAGSPGWRTVALQNVPHLLPGGDRGRQVHGRVGAARAVQRARTLHRPPGPRHDGP